MNKPTDWRPAVRHRRSQNAGVVYTLADEVPTAVDALMRLSFSLIDRLLRPQRRGRWCASRARGSCRLRGCWFSFLTEREHERPDTRIQELDLERAVLDACALS